LRLDTLTISSSKHFGKDSALHCPKTLSASVSGRYLPSMAPLVDIAGFHPLAVLSCLVIAGFVLKRLYYELTTGSRRRAMIREHGCKPVVFYEHRGIFGKLFGVDVMKALLGSAKRGTLHQESRIRNFTGRNTVMFRILRSKFIMTIE
jgi:hypothetical protein